MWLWQLSSDSELEDNAAIDVSRLKQVCISTIISHLNFSVLHEMGKPSRITIGKYNHK